MDRTLLLPRADGLASQGLHALDKGNHLGAISLVAPNAGWLLCKAVVLVDEDAQRRHEVERGRPVLLESEAAALRAQRVRKSILLDATPGHFPPSREE
jgi:hypothetical protein